MKKPFISVALSAMLLVSAAFPKMGITAMAETANAQSAMETQVEQDMMDTASYVMTELENQLENEEFQFAYNHYIQTVLAMKAGVRNETVIQALRDYLQTDENTIFHPAYNPSLSIAVGILFLSEIGEDVQEFQVDGTDVLTLLYDTFMEEETPNPYTYQYVSAALIGNMEDSDKLAEVMNKVQNVIIEEYYVENESGIGIDYWGVSADNNASVFSALYLQEVMDSGREISPAMNQVKEKLAASGLEYEGVSEKIEKSLGWTYEQRDETGAIVFYGAPSPNSTGLALRFASEFGDMEKAEVFYQGTQQFKSETTRGAYIYAGQDNLYATVDILWGLVAYDKALDGQWIFDLSVTEETPEPETTTEQETITEPESMTESETTTLQATESQSEGQDEEQTVPNTGDNHTGILFVTLLCIAAGIAITLKGRKDERTDY